MRREVPRGWGIVDGGADLKREGERRDAARISEYYPLLSPWEKSMAVAERWQDIHPDKWGEKIDAAREALGGRDTARILDQVEVFPEQVVARKSITIQREREGDGFLVYFTAKFSFSRDWYVTDIEALERRGVKQDFLEPPEGSLATEGSGQGRFSYTIPGMKRSEWSFTLPVEEFDLERHIQALRENDLFMSMLGFEGDPEEELEKYIENLKHTPAEAFFIARESMGDEMSSEEVARNMREDFSRMEEAFDALMREFIRQNGGAAQKPQKIAVVSGKVLPNTLAFLSTKPLLEYLGRKTQPKL